MARTAEVLWDHVRAQDLCPGARSLEAWLDLRWARMRVGPWSVPVLPLVGGLRERLVLHDVHHVLTGYDTSYAGEGQLAVWELASGGCGASAFLWLDRLTFVAIGLVRCPRRLPAAWRRGRRARNLYGARSSEVLATPLEVLRRRVRS